MGRGLQRLYRKDRIHQEDRGSQAKICQRRIVILDSRFSCYYVSYHFFGVLLLLLFISKYNKLWFYFVLCVKYKFTLAATTFHMSSFLSCFCSFQDWYRFLDGISPS